MLTLKDIRFNTKFRLIEADGTIGKTIYAKNAGGFNVGFACKNIRNQKVTHFPADTQIHIGPVHRKTAN